MTKTSKLILFCVIFLGGFFVCRNVQAAEHYVSPTGTATWASSTNIATPCSLATANTNAAAGDTVYLRGGTYSLVGANAKGINPSNSGTSPSKITFAKYKGETPIIEGDFATDQWGLLISKNYIVVDGIKFKDQKRPGSIYGGSYNEVKNCEFYHQGEASVASYAYIGFYIGYDNSISSTHNWFHDNSVHTIGQSGCNEGGDGIRIGSTASDDWANNYNTIEKNLIYHIGHALGDDFGMYNVWRNNIGHNEGWKTSSCVFGANTGGSTGAGCTVTITTSSGVITGAMVVSGGSNYAVNDVIGVIQTGPPAGSGSALTVTSVSGTAVTGLSILLGGSNYTDASALMTGTSKLIDTTKNFVTAGVAVGWNAYSSLEYNKRATIASISTTTNTNDTLNFIYASGSYGSPSFTSAVTYSVNPCDQSPDPTGTNPGDGKYGHRGFGLTGYDTSVFYRYILFEGNRSGYASKNPNNGGADGLTTASPGAIIRYNSMFGGDGPAINLKRYISDNGCCSGANSRIYNNTFYGNSNSVYSWANSPVYHATFLEYAVSSIGNVIKNNIMYQSGTTNWIGAGAITDQTWVNNWCSQTGCGSVGSADPLFTDTTITDMTSTTLPDLSLQSSSPAINAGTYLTTASGSGSNSTSLTVADALYFQDGTWGSQLTRTAGTMQADYIAIGTVTNAVQISSIDYSTNTITLASPMTWSNGASIWLYKKSDGTRVLYGSAPDMGAHEYISDVVDTTPPAAPTGLIVN